MKPFCNHFCVSGVLSRLAIFIMLSSVVRASPRAASASRRLAPSSTRRWSSSLAWATCRKASDSRYNYEASSHPDLTKARRTCQQAFLQAPIHNTLHSRLFSSVDNSQEEEGGIFADAGVTFESMGIKSKVLLERLEKLGHQRPTAVQAATFQALSTIPRTDMTIGAETGSG